MPYPFSILFTKALVLVRTFMNFTSKLEDALSMFNILSKSIDFSKEVYEFLVKVVLLVRSSYIF